MDWQGIVDLLESLQKNLKASPQNRFVDSWSVGGAAMSAADMAFAIDELISRASTAEAIDADRANIPIIQKIITTLRDSFVPNLMSNQWTHITFMATLPSIRGYLDESIGAEGVATALKLPRSYATKLRTAAAKLDATLSEIDDISGKIQKIQSAYDAAEDFPQTQRDLDAARKSIEEVRISISADAKTIDSLVSKSSKSVEDLDNIATKAEKVAQRVDSSYRAVTAQGLAQAFSSKEADLKKSIRLWVGCLIASLGGMAAIGYFRFPAILSALSSRPDWGIVTANVLLAGFSLGAPAWLAIVATKQIAQRFKLAEDYGYKAAVSAAYEGYRAESERFGDAFQARLFASTLDRLDEQPLRFIDHDTGGSPAHEILKSTKDLFDDISVKEKLERLLRPKRGSNETDPEELLKPSKAEEKP